MKLFVYGTLMYKGYLSRIGGVDESLCEAAYLEGYTRQGVGPSAPYPGIKSLSEGVVEGILIHDVSEESMVRLDRYEGGMYEQVYVTVMNVVGDTSYDCYTYVVRDEYLDSLNGEDWEPRQETIL